MDLGVLRMRFRVDDGGAEGRIVGIRRDTPEVPDKKLIPWRGLEARCDRFQTRERQCPSHGCELKSEILCDAERRVKSEDYILNGFRLGDLICGLVKGDFFVGLISPRRSGKTLLILYISASVNFLGASIGGIIGGTSFLDILA